MDTPDGKKVELYYQTLKLSPISMNVLKDIEHERITKLPEITLQFSKYATVSQFGYAAEDLIG